MNLGFCPLASSSSGNCYLIKSDSTNILVDAGISGSKIYECLKELKISSDQVDAVLLTHEHGDHVRSAATLAKKTVNAVFYATRGTIEGMERRFASVPGERLVTINGSQNFEVGDIKVTAFETSHDAAEPVSYFFCRKNKKIAIVTDTGVITPAIEEAIKDADILILESNHEVNILLYGRYPYNVKHRILSNIGHLSNEAAGECLCGFLRDRNSDNVPCVYLAHLSKENNTPQQAMLTVKNILEEENFYIGRHLLLEVLNQKDRGDLVTI